MKVKIPPCLPLIGATLVILSSAESSLDVQDNSYVITDLDDPLQPVWDTLNGLSEKTESTVATAVRNEFAQLNRLVTNKLQHIMTAIASLRVRLDTPRTPPARSGGSTSSTSDISQFYESRVLNDISETVTKIEGHVDAKLLEMRRYIDSKLSPAEGTEGEGHARGNTNGEGSMSLAQTLRNNTEILQSVIEHVIKINEKLGGSGEGGDTCGTLVDKVSEILDTLDTTSATRTGGGACPVTPTSFGLPRDCSDKHWQEPSGPSGVYEVYPTLDPKDPVTAYCDMGDAGAKDTGGWTVILRRRNTTFGLINFNRTWDDYRMGFGNPAEGEWWFGLGPLHALTYRQPFEVDLLLHDVEKGTFHAQYTTFRVEDESNKYKLLLNGFSGNLTHDALTAKHNGSPFTTWDRDYDAWSGGNCGQSNGGGWWFDACHFTTLTAPFPTSANREAKTIRWLENDIWLVLDDVTMKIRPFNYAQRFNAHTASG